MLAKLYKKSEVWFAVIFIVAYVAGNSVLMQESARVGFEMLYTIPYNLLLLGILLMFIGKMQLCGYYGLGRVQCGAGRLLYYVPLVMIATVNIWMGFRMNMDAAGTAVYFIAMVLTGIAEELLFRGLLFRAMSRDNVRRAIIVTSLTFGIGHIVNLVNGNSTDYVETICQIFYAVAIGFLLAAVLYAGESLIPCILTHSTLNALSTFSNEAAIAKIQIPVSVALCVISAVSAVLIFRNAKHKE